MNSDITLILDALVYGFCFTTLIIYCLSFLKNEKLKCFNDSFFQYAIKTIRVIAIGYFVYYLIDIIIFCLNEDYTIFNNRAIGPYWWAYWMMLLRPFVFCLLIQLLWLKKLQKKNVLNFVFMFIIFFVVLASGPNMERFVILVTSFHRDYTPDSFNLYNFEIGWTGIILLGITVRIFIFSGLVLVVRFIYNRLKTIA